MHGTDRLVVGVDAGGTTTRVLVADLNGAVLARAEGAPANPVTHGLDEAVRSLRATLTTALANIDAGRVGQVVLGLAGDHLARQAEPARTVAAMLGSLGLDCPHTVLGDALVAFAAATPRPDGRLLISGTGSVAVLIRDRRIVDTAGGYGWLLGDGGSGFWLGREAVRAAVDTLRGRAGAERLTRLVCASLLGPTHPAGAAGADQLLTAAYAGPPLALARLAPHVVRAVRAGELEAGAILDRGALHLDELLQQMGPGDPAEPVVLAGSCLAPEVLGERTAGRITARGSALVLRAQDGAAGAAWLAAARLVGTDPRLLAKLHCVLTDRGP